MIIYGIVSIMSYIKQQRINKLGMYIFCKDIMYMDVLSLQNIFKDKSLFVIIKCMKKWVWSIEVGNNRNLSAEQTILIIISVKCN